jgi:hypothetical protein
MASLTNSTVTILFSPLIFIYILYHKISKKSNKKRTPLYGEFQLKLMFKIVRASAKLAHTMRSFRIVVATNTLGFNTHCLDALRIGNLNDLLHVTIGSLVTNVLGNNRRNRCGIIIELTLCTMVAHSASAKESYTIRTEHLVFVMRLGAIAPTSGTLVEHIIHIFNHDTTSSR